MTIDDDVRTMLARRAEDVHASADAWDAIAGRLDEPQRSGRRFAALAGAAVAAALVAGVIVVAQNDEPSPPVTATTTAVEQPAALPSHVWEGEPGQEMREVAEDYIEARTDVRVTAADYEFTDETHAVGRFHANVAAEVFLQRDGERWFVIAAASDLVPIFNAHIEGTELVADVTVEMDGTLQLGFGGPFAGWDEPRDVEAGESVPVRQDSTGSFRALLRTNDGTVALSEVVPAGDPARPTGAIPYVWPATDPAGLVVLQEEASLGRRPDLLDPRAVAAGYLSNVLPSAATFSVDEFQQGDPRSGEVPYALDGEPAGTILVRRLADGNLWYVAGVVSPIVDVTDVQRITNGLRVHVRADFGSEAVVSVRNPGATSNTTASHAVSPEEPEFTVELGGASGNLWVQVVLHGEDGVIAIAVVPVS